MCKANKYLIVQDNKLEFNIN